MSKGTTHQAGLHRLRFFCATYATSIVFHLIISLGIIN